MTTRREFIKIAAGTIAIISLPAGLLAGLKEKKVIKVDAADITWEPATCSNAICWYYAPQITIKDYKAGEMMFKYKAGETGVGYEDLWADPNCDKCMYNKHRPKCLEVFKENK